jgi:hypothetical protein
MSLAARFVNVATWTSGHGAFSAHPWVAQTLRVCDSIVFAYIAGHACRNDKTTQEDCKSWKVTPQGAQIRQLTDLRQPR